MDAARWKSIETLFNAAWELPEPERPGFLDRAAEEPGVDRGSSRRFGASSARRRSIDRIRWFPPGTPAMRSVEQQGRWRGPIRVG